MLVSQMTWICHWFVETFIFISNCFNKYSFPIFNENSKLVSTTHSYNTRSLWNGLLFVPSYNSVRFERISVIHSNHSYMELYPKQANWRKVSVFNIIKSENIISKIFHFWVYIIAKLKASGPSCHKKDIL